MDKIIFDGLQIIKDNPAIFIAVAVLFAGAGYWFSERLTRKWVDESKAEVAKFKGLIEINNETKKMLEARIAGLETTTKANADDLANRKTMRLETTFGQAVERSGLVDIEWRDTKQKSLPPTEFYAAARSEVFILGISCKHTFTNDAEELKKLLQSGRSVCVMLVAPDSNYANQLCEREGFTLKDDINHVIQMAETKGLYYFDNLFSVRLTSEALAYTGVMIDGDIDCREGHSPRDTEAQIRIQPRTFFKSQHNGLIIQFRNTGEAGTYQYFSEDLRKLWRSGKVVHNPFIKQPT